MQKQLNEDEIINLFSNAIERNHIYPIYQPQVNHRTQCLIGAEALMRWHDPVYGMQYPNNFIPILEVNDLIFSADIHIFEEVCRFQKRCLDSHVNPLPISFNMSRFDIYNHNYVETIEDIRRSYSIPVKLLRVEITESSTIGGIDLVVDVIKKLHLYGYLVEMDDFGSGYSSLNILKDLNVDLIKLDMKFLNGK